MKRTLATGVALLIAVGLGFLPGTALAQGSQVMWINHLDFLAGDPSVTTSFNAVTSGVGGGLSGLIIESTTTGEDAEGGGNKVVEKGLQVPPGYLVSKVRVCYELSNARSFISQIRLAQVQDPPSTALVLLDDATDLTNAGPICVDSAGLTPGIDPSAGGLRLSLRVKFGDVTDIIVLRAVALYLDLDPDSALGQAIADIEDLRKDLQNHTHDYLTGQGVGHNNVVAVSGPPEFSATPPPPVTPPANNGNGGNNPPNPPNPRKPPKR